MSKSKKSDTQKQIKQKLERSIGRKQFQELLNSGKLLIILFEAVYDLSEFKNLHPGGNQILEEYKGKDASQKFVQFGHLKGGPNMIKMLSSFRIGKLEQNPSPKF